MSPDTNPQPKIIVSTEKPPNWGELVKTFGVTWGGNPAVIVAYGDTIHCSGEPTEDVLQHEMVHLAQQKFNKKDAKEWWNRYIKDSKFRLEQETPAYQRQYRLLALFIHDRNELSKERSRLAKDMSGSMYGHMISYSEALKLLR